MNKYFLMLAVVFFSVPVEAGVVELTIHSRANCINNESVTWDMRWNRTYATMSLHFKNIKNQIPTHDIFTGLEETWRSAAVHWNEALPGDGWKVIGLHWIKDPGTERLELIGQTEAIDCNIYDGWWDH